MAKKKKDKKDKIIYYDDNSTVSDMSGVRGRGKVEPQVDRTQADPKKTKKKETKPRSSGREKFNTYWETVKTMFVPMCAVLLILAILYLILTFIPFLI